MNRKIHEGKGICIPDPVFEKVEPLLPREKTQTHRRELIFQALLEKIAKNPNTILTSKQLALIYRSYAITLLLADLDNQHTALQEKKWIGLKRTNDDLSGELSYALPRLISKDDIEKLADAKIYLTDNAQAFFLQPSNQIKRCSARGRLYAVKQNQDGSYSFTFLIRKTDTLEPATDALEILSLISVIELARTRMKNVPIKSKNDSGPNGKKKKRTLYKDELSKATGREWSTKEVKQWANGSGITLCGSNYGLRDYKSAPKLEETIHYEIVEQIKKKLETLDLAIPQAAILGNDFALPILAATGIFTQEDMDILQSDEHVDDPLQALNGTIKPEKLSPTQQDIVRRYGYLQFINRYTGENKKYNELKTQLQAVIALLKMPLFSATQTALADPIDYYNFGNLEQTYIDQIPDETIRGVLQKAKENNFTALNFSYPLGDNTYGLVKSLNKVFGIRDIGFFGKVGATLDFLTKSTKEDTPENQKKGLLSGPQVGRIALPEKTILNKSRAKAQPFLNSIQPEDVLIIPASDRTEVIAQVNGLFLQALEDIKFIREKLLRKRIIEPYSKNSWTTFGMARTTSKKDRSNYFLREKLSPTQKDPKEIKVLLDMESHHLLRACRVLGILPSVCYYTSDNTKIPPVNLEQSHGETLVTSLGARGSFAVLISAATVLNDLLKRLFPE